ncbi:hypothetical protein BsWGS_20493 [Bradybaena similaris]
MAMVLDESHRFKHMIIKIGRLIKEDELKTLKFLCKDIIPTKFREKVSTTEALVELLEERGKVSPRDLTYLKQILQDGLHGRTDILQVVAEYEQRLGPSPDVDSAPVHQNFSREILCLEENLGKEYKSFLRRLGLGDHHIERIELENPKSVREQIHQCLRVWMRQNSRLQHSQLVDAVVKALQKEKRIDLATRIREENFE